MPRGRTKRRRNGNGRAGPRRQHSRALKLWPDARTRKRLFTGLRRAPLGVQITVSVVVLAIVAIAFNWLYQVVRKPSELFFPVSGTLYKTPTRTWASYSPIFKRHATAAITPEFLAALAQIEGSGNPVVRTYWRMSLSSKPFDIYRPASSAVGMYQITNSTFAEARHFCIHDHAVVEDGPWNDWQSCWFNALYIRTVPSHAVELTSAYLDHQVAMALKGRNATSRQKYRLAAVIHLCGAGAGRSYAARGLRLLDHQRCGDHEVARYLAKVSAMQGVFRKMD